MLCLAGRRTGIRTENIGEVRTNLVTDLVDGPYCNVDASKCTLDGP